MYIIETVLLTKIPIQKSQILSYFSAHPLAAGCLISVPLGRRLTQAIVVETHQIHSLKMEIKSANYELRPIKKIISGQPILTKQQIKLGLWLGQYYFASPGLFMKMMLPKNTQYLRIKKKKLRTKQKLLLVPTITQIDFVLKKHKKTKIAIIHSGLKPKQLNENWQKIASAESKIIIGTRLAAFAPFVNLKEITIEDETNSSHRSWDMRPHYRAHEVARKLAEIFDANLIIKSELPSVESFFLTPQTQTKHDLEPKPTDKTLPPWPDNKSAATGYPVIIDMRAELREGNFSIFSRHLQKSINQALEKKEKIILFINRRGAATFVLCRDCGFVAKCQNCDTPLTYHLTPYQTSDDRQMSDRSLNLQNRQKPILLCHRCGKKIDPPSLCPNCQSHRIKAFGSGTQRVEIEAQKLFKNAKILRLDSDAAKNQQQQKEIIEQFQQKKANILIGTQMLLNSDLKKSGLVAVISADTLMHLPDFRSDERIFQTIHSLKKIAGRELIIQTYNPQNKILELAARRNFKNFFEQEIETRKVLNYPPFSQLAKLIFRHKNPEIAGQQAKILFAKLTQQQKNSKILKDILIEIIGPAPAFIAKQKSKYVWQIILKIKSPWLLKSEMHDDILKLRNKFLMTVPAEWEIEVDPETLL